MDPIEGSEHEPTLLTERGSLPVLIDPPCVPFNRDKFVFGTFDFRIGRLLATHYANRHTPVGNILVGDDAVWCGDGLVLPVLIEHIVMSLVDNDTRKHVRMFVPLDTGGVASYAVTGGKVHSSTTIRHDLALDAVRALDVQQERPALVLMLRNDIEVPPALRGETAFPIPGNPDFTPFVTTPAAKAMLRKGMPMPSFTRKTIGGSACAAILLCATMFAYSLLSGAAPIAAAPSNSESVEDDFANVMDMDMGEIVSRVEIAPDNSTVPVDVHAVSPTTRSSARWDMAAWINIASAAVWPDLGVRRLAWHRDANGEVTINALGKESALWTMFAIEWNAEVHPSATLSLPGDAGGDQEDMSAIVKWVPGGWDVRKPTGSLDTIREFCRRSHGIADVVDGDRGMISCDIHNWVRSRWNGVSLFMPGGKLADAYCDYETGRLTPVRCLLSFNFAQQRRPEVRST